MMLHLSSISDSLASGAATRKSAPRVICIPRSEEHTSELQSRFDLVCRLPLEKTKIAPLVYCRLSDNVVFSASTWARMQIFIIFMCVSTFYILKGHKNP